MNRRSLILGLGAVLATPAIVRAENLMKLWVPPKPKLITSVDLSDEGDWSGFLWTADGEKSGWWRQKSGRFDFRWDDPEPTGYWSQGTNNSYESMVQLCNVHKVRPYPGPVPHAA